MTVEEIKTIFASNFSELPTEVINQYLTACDTMISKMVTVDPIVFDLIDKLEHELTIRGVI